MTKENGFDNGFLTDSKQWEKTIKENDLKRAEESRASLQALTDKAERKRAADQELFNKALLKTRKEEEEKRAVELEKAKARALNKVEEEYEKHGVKSSKTEKLENAYRSMLGNLRGLDD